MGIPYWRLTEQEQACFASRVVVDCASECMVWVGALNSYGYGAIHRGGKTYLAHRLAWTTWRGEIPEGLCIDHLCRVRSCQNVDHMEVVDKVTNTMRGMGIHAVNARKTHCRLGHALAGENLVLERGPTGGRLRRCRTCRNEYAKHWQMAKRRLMVNTPEDLEQARRILADRSL